MKLEFGHMFEWKYVEYKLKAIDVLLGMEWLWENHILLEEFKRVLGMKEQHVIFQGKWGNLTTCIMSFYKAIRMISRGYKAFLVILVESKS